MTRRVRSFYARALTAADRAALDDAREVEGIDDEVALLRLQIRELIANEEPDARVVQGAMRLLVQVQGAMRLLVQAVVTQQRLSGQQAEGLTEATTRLFEEFATVLSEADGGAP